MKGNKNVREKATLKWVLGPYSKQVQNEDSLFEVTEEDEEPNIKEKGEVRMSLKKPVCNRSKSCQTDEPYQQIDLLETNL